MPRSRGAFIYHLVQTVRVALAIGLALGLSTSCNLELTTIDASLAAFKALTAFSSNR